MTTFVLVPGFWLGGWAWDDVAARLREAGHEVIAVTPSGAAERAEERDVTLESRVAELVELLRAHRDVVLVGHSIAGTQVAAAAERAREHVARLVLVDTGALPSDMSFLDFVAPEAREWVEKQLAEHGGRYPMPGRERLAELGASTEGIAEEAFDDIHARATPEPAGTVTGTVRRGTPDPTLPKTVIACSFTEAAARAAIDAGVPGYAELADPEWSFVELSTGHWPMFSRPAELADVLVRLAA
jgi:pimeloyl-ACP methyl ester carboxylesterase